MNKQELTNIASLGGTPLDFSKISQKIANNLPNTCTTTLEAQSHSFYSYVPSFRGTYATMRISNHLPYFKNIFKYGKFIPSNRPNANVCLMFFGSIEASDILSSSNSYEMTIRNRRVEITREKYAFMRKLYSENPDITYKIYHYITNYLSESDIDLISQSVNDWMDSYGNSEYIHPNGLKAEAIGNTINTSIIFKFRKMNEDVDNLKVFVKYSNDSIIDALVESVEFIDEETKKSLGILDVYVSIKSASDEQIKLIKSELFGDTKNRMTLENRKILYNSIMQDIAKIVKRRINEAFSSDDN